MSGVEERAAALTEAADFISETSGIGTNTNDYSNGWYAALDYAIGELRNRAANLLAQPTADEVEGDERDAAEAFLREWSRPYFGEDIQDAVAAVMRAARAAGFRRRDPDGLRERVAVLHHNMLHETEYGTMPGVRMRTRVHWANRLVYLLAADTLAPAQPDKAEAVECAITKAGHCLGAAGVDFLTARHEQATQEADRRVAEVVAAVEAEVFSENASAVLHGVTGTHPGSYGGVSKDEALECAADLIERVRGILTNFRSEVTGGGGDG